MRTAMNEKIQYLCNARNDHFLNGFSAAILLQKKLIPGAPPLAAVRAIVFLTLPLLPFDPVQFASSVYD
jgi:hypothetical protein